MSADFGQNFSKLDIVCEICWQHFLLFRKISWKRTRNTDNDLVGKLNKQRFSLSQRTYIQTWRKWDQGSSKTSSRKTYFCP